MKRRETYYIIGETAKGKDWLFRTVHGGYKGFVVIAEEFMADYEAMWIYEGITYEYLICHPQQDNIIKDDRSF